MTMESIIELERLLAEARAEVTRRRAALLEAESAERDLTIEVAMRRPPPEPEPMPDPVPVPPAPGDWGSDWPKATGPEVRLQPGDPVPSLISAAPPGARFLLYRGTHLDTTSFPTKAGQQFIAAEEDVVVNLNGLPHLMRRQVADDVVLAGFEVRGSRGTMGGPGSNGQPGQAVQHGAIDARPDATSGLQLWDMTLRDIDGQAVVAVARTEIHRGLIEDCGSLGIGGAGHDILIDGTTIRRCNNRGYGTGWAAANVKLTGGRRDYGTNGPPRTKIIVRNFLMEDCDGRGGLWFDWDLSDVLVEDGVVRRTGREALTYEASAKGTFRRLKIERPNNSETQIKAFKIWRCAIALQNSKDCLLEDIEIIPGEWTAGAVAIMNHWRKRLYPIGAVGSNAGQTIGPFEAVRNTIRGLILPPGLPELIVDAHADYYPTPVEVRQSNIVSGTIRR